MKVLNLCGVQFLVYNVEKITILLRNQTANKRLSLPSGGMVILKRYDMKYHKVCGLDEGKNI